MFKLRTGYFISGIATGLVLLLSFVWTLPDGKLHIVFCDVGQGDAAYIRFPDGRDMVVDGGPNDRVIGCLGRHMPFWDRHLDMVAMTHPQKDHMQGLISVFARYRVDYFLKSDIANATEGYQMLMREIGEKKVPVKLTTRGQKITLGATTLSFLWPSDEQIARMRPPSDLGSLSSPGNVLGISSPGDLNDGSLVFWLRYGSFDALFPGDADQHVEHYYTGHELADDTFEVLKVPHHGSKTGMTDAFLDWLKPRLAVISVGKNSYGHPAESTLATLAARAIPVKRTDQEGDIEVVSDGKIWYTSTK